MKPTINSHLKQHWQAHDLVSGFRIEDIWHLPIQMKPETPIRTVQEAFVEAIDQIGTKGFAGLLFKFRTWLGQVFHWEDSTQSRESLPPGILKRRYAEKTNTPIEQLPKGGFDHFDLVYQLDNESLLEIENKTVQAAIHLSKIQEGLETNAQMTIYVKPNGWFGRVYMLIIKPFRHWIVYPGCWRINGIKNTPSLVFFALRVKAQNLNAQTDDFSFGHEFAFVSCTRSKIKHAIWQDNGPVYPGTHPFCSCCWNWGANHF